MTSVAARAAALVDSLEETFMALALAVMTSMTFAHVIARYVFGSGLIWSLEVTTYSFAWLVLIGMSYGVRTKTHITVDLLTRRLGERGRFVAAAIALALCLCYSGLLAYGSVVFVDRLMTLGNDARDIPVPRWALASVMPVAFGLLGWRFIQAFVEFARQSASAESHADAD